MITISVAKQPRCARYERRGKIGRNKELKKTERYASECIPDCINGIMRSVTEVGEYEIRKMCIYIYIV